MAIVIALNIFFIAAVVLGIVTLLALGIITDRRPRTERSAAALRATARAQARAPRVSGRPAYARG